MNEIVLGPLQKALVNAGLAKPPKPKKRRPQKDIKCFKCGQSMVRIEDTNTMACSNPKCSNYRIFSSNK